MIKISLEEDVAIDNKKKRIKFLKKKIKIKLQMIYKRERLEEREVENVTQRYFFLNKRL